MGYVKGYQKGKNVKVLSFNLLTINIQKQSLSFLPIYPGALIHHGNIGIYYVIIISGSARFPNMREN